MKPVIYIAIPAMDEADYLPRTMAALFSQEADCSMHVYVCVNQPEDYWLSQPDICESNRRTMEYLRKLGDYRPGQPSAERTEIDCRRHHADCRVILIDRSSRGRGWQGRQYGVGMARKTLFEAIVKTASPDDLIVSLDADTHIATGYLQSLIGSFRARPTAMALAVPYYHPLGLGNDRAILHYEIYMRCYHLNMLRIGSPYAFTALGSALVFPCRSYSRVGGMTPAKSGEDFYLLQKFCKHGEVLHWNGQCVYPSARLSTRVGFGTGPALIKGNRGDWHSYPVYPPALFDEVRRAYELLPELFRHDIRQPFLDFLAAQFKETSPWQPLRENFKDLPHFVRAFHEKADALRILQFLKQQLMTAMPPSASEAVSLESPTRICDSEARFCESDARALDENLKVFARHFAPLLDGQTVPKLVTEFHHARLEEASTELLVQIREQLFQMEMAARRQASGQVSR